MQLSPFQRFKFWLLGLSVILVLGIGAMSLHQRYGKAPALDEQSQTLLVGERAPEFSLLDLSGNNVQLSEYRGQPVMINFWATWCPSCRVELPYIQKIYDRYKDKGLVILAISTDQQQNQLEYFARMRDYSFPILIGSENVISDYYAHRIPIVYLIDQDGFVNYHHIGFRKGEELEIEEHIEMLLTSHTKSKITLMSKERTF